MQRHTTLIRGLFAGLISISLGCSGLGDREITVLRTGGPAPVAVAASASAVPPATERTSGAEADEEAAPAQDAFNREGYDHTPETPMVATLDRPLSTFSVDVDTASYSNVRRFLTGGVRPPADAVRIEELINYFDYDYGMPKGDHPIAIATEVADCPWDDRSALVRIGLRARDVAARRDPAKNLVFLLDVSGSMESPQKLPLLKRSLMQLTRQLTERDRVGIVVYAGASGVVLEPTAGNDRDAIEDALNDLRAGGSTNGAAGLELAYRLAAENLVHGAINRVILATDGDFNVGVSSRGGLQRLIEKQRDRGIFLTVLGFGMGNLQDSAMEMLADKGNGNYAYIDTDREARKVLVDEVGSTLHTVAKDTKIQIELNPAVVSEYRLLGYENRRLADEDFNDDRKDAGDMGDGHTVTALYEVRFVADGVRARRQIDPLKYGQRPALRRSARDSGGALDEIMTVKVRYKDPDARDSRLLSHVVKTGGGDFFRASQDFRFAVAVAAFGLILRDSPTTGGMTMGSVRQLVGDSMGRDRHGLRGEFLELLQLADRAPQRLGRAR